MGTIIGIIIGGGLLFFAIIQRGGFGIFYDPPSLMIVGGGTFAAALISFPLNRVLSVFRVLRNVFQGEIEDPGAYISAIIRLTHKARKESILALEGDVRKVRNRFLRRGLELVIDGQPPEVIRAVLETELEGLLARHDEGSHIFATLGRFAPAFGLIGTLIGLITMLRSISGGIESVGPGMAVALVTTFYGALAANLLFLPISEKLSSRSETEVF